MKRALLLLCLGWSICPGALPDQLTEIRKLLKGDPVAADAMAATLLSSNASSAPVHAAAGEVAFRLGDFERAGREYQAALRLDPKNARALRGNGKLAEIASYRKTAKRLYEQAYASDPDDAEVLRDWAGTQQGDAEIAALERYLSIARDADEEELDDVRAHLALHRGTRGRELNRLTSPYRPTQIRLERVLNDRQELRGYAVEVRINQSRIFRLLLDTGASGVILNHKAGKRAKLESVSLSPLRGVGDDGDAPSNAGVAETLSAGGLEFSDYVVRVSKGTVVSSLDGIIGTDVFQQFVISLDLPGRMMGLAPFTTADGKPVDPEDDTHDRERRDGFVDVFHVGAHLLIRGSANGSGPALFLIDSGAYNNVVSREFAARFGNIRAEHSLRLTGVAGKVRDVYKVDRLDLRFAHVSQTSTGVLSFDFSRLCRQEGVEVAGLLGFPTLAPFVLDIDYRNGLVRLFRR